MEHDVIIDDISDVDDPIITIFGLSPIRLSPTQVIAWSSLIGLIIATFVLFTFSEQYAGLGVMALGITMGIFKVPLGLISDDVLNWVIVSVLIMLGLLAIFVFKKRS